MPQYESPMGNGTSTGSNHEPRIGERMDNLGDSAQAFITEARSAVQDLTQTIDLKGRLQRNPYGTLAMAVGVGYLLGGGLFTSTTSRLFKLGVRLAALPFVKDELLHMAESALSGLTGSAGGSDVGTTGTERLRGPQLGGM